jgi:hypothetical protein
LLLARLYKSAASHLTADPIHVALQIHISINPPQPQDHGAVMQL